MSETPNTETFDRNTVSCKTAGCSNCLWSGCECTGKSKYEPSKEPGEEGKCLAWTYYD